MGHISKTIKVTDLRECMREVLENAHFRGQHYVVERAGRPMVAILSVEDYESLLRQSGGQPHGSNSAARNRNTGDIT